ncbi:hypothetical protein [Planococcus donghaensis]|uniref:hypothetical protein n=1 Tax=Planococcus donghaensis TaxID=414778 RepID=UPI003736B128
MKKLFMILFAAVLVFGFASSSLAGGKDDSHVTKTVTFEKGVTTIVTTTVDVSHDKEVEVKKSTNTSTVKKSKKDVFEKVDVVVTKEKHPKNHKLYRDVKTETTYKVIKVTTWDEVTKTKKIKTITTPVKIIKTTVNTLKHRGAPGSNGKVISDETKVHTEKKYGKPEVKVTTKKQVSKENVKTSTTKKVIDVKVTYGEWKKHH